MFLPVSSNLTGIVISLRIFAGYWPQYRKHLCVLASAFIWFLYLLLTAGHCLLYHSFGRP